MLLDSKYSGHLGGKSRSLSECLFGCGSPRFAISSQVCGKDEGTRMVKHRRKRRPRQYFIKKLQHRAIQRQLSSTERNERNGYHFHTRHKSTKGIATETEETNGIYNTNFYKTGFTVSVVCNCWPSCGINHGQDCMSVINRWLSAEIEQHFYSWKHQFHLPDSSIICQFFERNFYAKSAKLSETCS